MVGIYIIENLENGKVYIGQSINIEERWASHIRASNSKKCNGYNYYIHKAFRKYGIDHFSFSVLEECTAEKLNEREAFWIRIFHSDDSSFGYNLTKGGDNTASHLQKPIYQIDLDTKEILHRYNSCFEAGRFLNVNQANIRHCCEGKYRYAYGYLWVYQDQYNPVEIRNRKISKNLSAHGARAKEVFQLDKNTRKVINTFISTNEASKVTNIGRSNIGNCLAGLTKTAGGYAWAYQEGGN